MFAFAALLLAACSEDTTTPEAIDAGANTGPGMDAFVRPDVGNLDCLAGVFLDVTLAPGPGATYPAPTLTVTCESDALVVTSNAIPHYTFVPKTNEVLVASAKSWRVTRFPGRAARPTELDRGAEIGFSISGLPLWGPTDGAAQTFGDAVHKGSIDRCLGHFDGDYHLHGTDPKCMGTRGLVAEPWANPAVRSDVPSRIVGVALDGFPIYGPYGCADFNCTRVIEYQSSWQRNGDPSTNAWDAYVFTAQTGEAFLDRCNGHAGPAGDYHYHATAGFPYALGCYTGTPASGATRRRDAGAADAGMGAMDAMPPRDAMPRDAMPRDAMPRDAMPRDAMLPLDGAVGPTSCTMTSECTNACPPGSMGCDCVMTPMGMVCVPTCMGDEDCPTTPMGQLRCNTNLGICVR